MGIDQVLVLSVSVPTVAAYICRLTMLSVWDNRISIVALHASLAMASGWAGYHAFTDSLTAGDIVSLVGAVSWIIVSLPTWVGGVVPPHFNTRPRRLSRNECTKVYGGKK